MSYLFSADWWLEAALRSPARRASLVPLLGIDAPLRDLKTAARSVALARGIEAAMIAKAKQSAENLGA